MLMFIFWDGDDYMLLVINKIVAETISNFMFIDNFL
jgi:hypothetical protein